MAGKYALSSFTEHNSRGCLATAVFSQWKKFLKHNLLIPLPVVAASLSVSVDDPVRFIPQTLDL